MATPEDMEANMIANLAIKTGKNLDQWLEIAKTSGLSKHGELMKFLKAEHGLTHGYANLVVHKMLNSAAASFSEDDLISGQYGGAKAGLRPIYDGLIELVKGFGPDVEIAPKKAYVSLRRKKQFAIFQPSIATRLDVGINLKGVAPDGRLEASGSFNAMVSHRVRLSNLADVDAQLTGWLKAAYEVS